MRSVSIAASAAALFAALAAAAPSPLVVRSTSLDGSCGNAYAGNNQGHSCPTGMCCSEYGWCGTETDHCGAGCQSAFGGCGNVVVTPPVVISPDWTCGGEKGYTCPEGYCCSEYGWCGTGAGFCDSLCNPLFGTCDGATPSPVATPPTTPTVAPTTAVPTAAPTGIISPDWTCGPTHNNYVCPTGYCCSEYGYCGTGVGYCDSSCNPLFGGCDGASSTPVSSAVPSPTPSVIISPDFTCGGTNGYTCPDNLCCSEYGWCGTGAGFCDAACQPLFGNCDSKSPTATATAPTTTATGAYTPPAQRPTPGSIPYGVNVFSCNVPGVVALTYDDGPFHYTAELLDILAQYNAKATFFVNALTWDGRIDDAAKPWPATMARMIAEGHQVGSHTYSHADMSVVDEPEKVRQMVDLETAFVSLIGRIPTYMRPPYLSCDAGCQNIMTRLGYHIIDTDLDTKDWDHNTPETNYLAQERVTNAIATKNPSSGSFLVLNHDVHPTTVQILTPFMLQEFQEAGYRFVTVGECLGDPAANWYRSA